MTASILIVEDDPDLRTALAAALRDDGYAVRAAHDGAQALTLHRAEPADLIITDLMMPVMTGGELIATIRASGDTTPMLLITAVAATTSTQVTAIAAGDPSILIVAKPFDLSRFFALIEDVLHG
jgi:two-component system response regulator MprA